MQWNSLFLRQFFLGGEFSSTQTSRSSLVLVLVTSNVQSDWPSCQQFFFSYPTAQLYICPEVGDLIANLPDLLSYFFYYTLQGQKQKKNPIFDAALIQGRLWGTNRNSVINSKGAEHARWETGVEGRLAPSLTLRRLASRFPRERNTIERQAQKRIDARRLQLCPVIFLRF